MNKFIQEIDTRIDYCIETFKLFENARKIIVAVSGGKDSLLALHSLHRKKIPCEALTIDLEIGCYSKKNVENIKQFCKERNIKLHEVSFKTEFGKTPHQIQSILELKGEPLKTCTVCGVLRRTILNRKARELDADILVTGHNLDDEAQSFLMNIIRNTPHLMARMGPENGIIRKEKFVRRAKPLYFVNDTEANQYAREMKWPVQLCECPCSWDSFRKTIKEMLYRLEKEYPRTKKRIIEYFLNIKPKLMSKYNESEFGECSNCHEPCSQEICKPCKIMEKI